jgi:hypothetical protein
VEQPRSESAKSRFTVTLQYLAIHCNISYVDSIQRIIYHPSLNTYQYYSVDLAFHLFIEDPAVYGALWVSKAWGDPFKTDDFRGQL